MGKKSPQCPLGGPQSWSGCWGEHWVSEAAFGSNSILMSLTIRNCYLQLQSHNSLILLLILLVSNVIYYEIIDEKFWNYEKSIVFEES
jgi:hypothetical protein